MQAQVAVSKGTFFQANNWTDEDWDKIAVELKSRYPQRNFSTLYQKAFTLEEFEDAAESVIPQERQKSFESFSDVRGPLLFAFERLKGSRGKASAKTIPTGTKRVDGSIHWSPAQWEEVVLELHQLYPDIFQDRLQNIRIKQIDEAVKVFPLEWRRYFNNIEKFRSQALRTWDSLPADVRNPALAERAIIDFPSGPVMAPPVKKSDSSNAMAKAMQEGFKTAEIVKERKEMVRWTPEEWLAVAREMLAQNPHANYLTSSFSVMDLPAIRDAQREALPIERRKVIVSNDKFRKGFIDAFARLKEEIQAKESQERATLDEVKAEVQAPTAPAEVVEKLAPTVEVKPPEQFAMPTSEGTTDFYGKVLNAAVPLLNVIINEAVQRLAPSLIAGMLPQLEKSLGGMIERAITAQIANLGVPATLPIAPSQVVLGTGPDASEQPQRPSRAEVMAMLPQPTEKPKKPKIALLMPGGSQREQMRTAFPEYEFIFIDHGKGIKEAAASCVLFVAVDAYVNVGNKQNIRAHVPQEKLRFVDGGLSSIKRQINVWKAEQK